MSGPKFSIVYLDLYLHKDLSEFNRFEARVALQNFITDLDRLFEKHGMKKGRLDASGEFVPYDNDDDDAGIHL